MVSNHQQEMEFIKIILFILFLTRSTIDDPMEILIPKWKTREIKQITCAPSVIPIEITRSAFRWSLLAIIRLFVSDQNQSMTKNCSIECQFVKLTGNLLVNLTDRHSSIEQIINIVKLLFLSLIHI